jgi:transposase
MRFVEAQQEVLVLHRVRALLIRERTALMNQMRGLLVTCGIVVAQDAARLRRTITEILGDRDQRGGEILREALLENEPTPAVVRGATRMLMTGRLGNSRAVTAAPAG